MIIPDSFRQVYNSHAFVTEAIKSEADSLLQSVADQFFGVAYYSRIKSLESTFTKALLGNYENPFIEMEDFLACTLVAPTLLTIAEIKTEVAKYFEVEELNRKTPNPFEFQYTDLHLILTLKDSPMRVDKSAIHRKIELQIKTLLQAAWSQAGHDVVYKPAKISWGAERIAGQLRALLELADSVLAQIEATAKLLHSQADTSYSDYKGNVRQIIEIMEKHWSTSQLPEERKRMAEIINKYLQSAGIEPTDLEKLIEDAKDKGNQVFNYLTLPAVQQVFVLIYLSNTSRIQGKLASGKLRVLITEEMVDFFPVLGNIAAKGRVNYDAPSIK